MAAEAPMMPVNGNYAPHAGYGGIESQQNSYAYGNSSMPKDAAPVTSAPAPAAAGSQQSDIPKDEVGWYFVEQYYTTLSRSPERLYLFYNKRSQFVSGQETDKVTVCVGQRAINDRIKELDFQDCKVRVTNVDSQASDSNIVIQVIGEISNKSQPHKKFTQTFVLATQTNGYFVLNDIFRYLIDEEDEPQQQAEPAMEEVQQVPAAESGFQEPAPTATETEPKGLTSSDDPSAVERDAKQVDKELSEKVLTGQTKSGDAAPPAVNGVAAKEPAEKHAANAPVAAVPAQTTTADAARSAAVEEEPQPEKPKAPEQTPSASPPKTAPAQPAPAPKPAAPKTWASLAASANRVVTPATPSSASSTTSQTKAAPKAAAAATSTGSAAPATQPAAPTAPATQRDQSPDEGSQGEEWTAVGSSHNRQQSRQVNNQQEVPQYRGYIGNVHESVDPNELKAQVEAFGEIAYFDVSRQKNCAFVDFKTADGYNAALNANVTVGGETLKVVQRHPNRRDGPAPQRGQYQGGRGRGGANQGAPRGNYQGRGGYAARGSRGGAAARGRGSSQAA